MIFSFKNMIIPKKVNYLLRQHDCSFTNMTFSRKDNYLLRKYDKLIKIISFSKKIWKAGSSDGGAPSRQCPGTLCSNVLVDTYK